MPHYDLTCPPLPRRVRGKPEGDTAQERIRLWLSKAPNVGENMMWVGKDYSLAQLKADVREYLTQGSATYGAQKDAQPTLCKSQY